MRAALRALRAERPAALVAAAPIASVEACAEVAEVADDVVCAARPRVSRAADVVWYRDVSLPSDDEARGLLSAARLSHDGARAQPARRRLR
jgi:predicted phosphoribosyltransferase